MAPRVIAALVIFLVVAAFSKQAVADEAHFVMNFDLITKSPDGSVEGNIQLQGVRLLSGKSFRGDDLGEFDYFFTVQEVEGGKGKLTIEFYLYETRKQNLTQSPRLLPRSTLHLESRSDSKAQVTNSASTLHSVLMTQVNS